MDFAVCSRGADRDYAWDNARAPEALARFARETAAPALEGSLTASRFAALFRCPEPPAGEVLCVSVSTGRRDPVGRPIRTVACLRAEEETERQLLEAFFAECLRHPDANTLRDAESGIAKAVESIYRTKGLARFTEFCRSLPKAAGQRTVDGAQAEPRGDMEKRSLLADALPALAAGNRPFFLALTDRGPDAVLGALGPFAEKAGVVRIFSGAISESKPLCMPTRKGGQGQSFLGRKSGFVAAIVALLAICLGLTAAFQTMTRRHVVKFVDEDGREISAAEYAHGTKAAGIVRPANPSKLATEQYTYAFAGWRPEVADVTGGAIYTATYRATVNRYTVRFADEDGTVISAADYPYGTPAADIAMPAAPAKAATEQYTYAFAGWRPEVADVTGDATYTAAYSTVEVQPAPDGSEFPVGEKGDPAVGPFRDGSSPGAGGDGMPPAETLPDCPGDADASEEVSEPGTVDEDWPPTPPVPSSPGFPVPEAAMPDDATLFSGPKTRAP